MEKLKGTFLKWGSLVASLALVLGVTSANVACMCWFHQPEMPKSMDKFKKFN